VFDCLSQPAFVQLHDQRRGTWAVSIVNPATGGRCYALSKDVPGVSRRKALVWNCQTYQRTRFEVSITGDTVRVSADGCGARLLPDEADFTGASQTFPAYLDCDRPAGMALKILTRTQLALLEESVKPITGTGCPLLTSRPGSGDAFSGVFRAACTFKDVCYANPWKGKGACDDEFLTRMTAECEVRFEGDLAQRAACVDTAQRYQLRAIADLDSYDQRQRKVRNAIRRGAPLLRYL